MSDPDACSCCGEPVAPTLPDGEWACGCEWEGCDENCPVVGYLHSTAFDGEEGDGLSKIARISEDADLYRKTEGIIIRREGESNARCS